MHQHVKDINIVCLKSFPSALQSPKLNFEGTNNPDLR